MQFRVLSAFVFFIGSYLPLSLLLLAQNFDYASLENPICWKVWTNSCSFPFKNPGIALSIFVTCVLCFIATLLTLKIVRPKVEIVIQDAKHVPADLMNYTLPYVVSFMSIDYQDIGKYIGVLIFLGWMFWITYKSGQIVLNPVLIAFGWKLYDVTYTFSGSDKVHSSNALVRGSIGPGETYRQVPVQDILIIKAEAKES